MWLGSDGEDPERGPDSQPGAGDHEADDSPVPAQEESPDTAPPAGEQPAFGADGPVDWLELGVDLIVLNGDGTLEVLTADGDRRVLADGLPDATALRLAADEQGGVVWQAVDNSADVVHVDSRGQANVLWPVGPDERIALVGFDEGSNSALVVRSVGTNPDDTTGDLLAVPLDGGPPTVVREGITAWESGISFAAIGPRTLLYGLFDAAFEGVFVWPDGVGEPALLLEAGELTGEYIRGVTIADASTGVVLVEAAAGFPERPAARLLLVDLDRGEAAKELPVPADITEGDPWHVPRDVSAAGGFVLINRYAEGTWLAPLVYDLASGGWAVLDGVNGRAFLHGP